MTIIVPVWNRRDLLEKLLCSLRVQTHPIGEVLVVDDGSQDDGAEVARAAGARYIRMTAHGGFAKAVNRGIRENRTPLAAIVNNDVDLAPDWLAKLTAALSSDTWFATGRILQAADRGRIDATYDVLCRGGTPWRVGQGSPDGPAFQRAQRIWSAPFTAAVFRAALFEKIGLLDERFESYLEDVDFGVRCARAGCAGCFVPEALAWHQGSATLGRWHPESTRLMARNQVYLVAKHYPTQLLIRYAWPIVVAQALWGIMTMKHGRGWAWLSGKLEGLRRVGEFRNISPADGLAALLAENDREIRRLSKDWYWRVYCVLTRVGQSDTP